MFFLQTFSYYNAIFTNQKKTKIVIGSIVCHFLSFAKFVQMSVHPEMIEQVVFFFHCRLRSITRRVPLCMDRFGVQTLLYRNKSINYENRPVSTTTRIRYETRITNNRIVCMHIELFNLILHMDVYIR